MDETSSLTLVVPELVRAGCDACGHVDESVPSGETRRWFAAHRRVCPAPHFAAYLVIYPEGS